MFLGCIESEFGQACKFNIISCDLGVFDESNDAVGGATRNGVGSEAEIVLCDGFEGAATFAGGREAADLKIEPIIESISDPLISPVVAEGDLYIGDVIF